MSTILDHLYSDDTKSSALENKITNLSNITVKNNIQDQRIPQQKISQSPTQSEHIVRRHDITYYQVVNKSGNWTGETEVSVGSGAVSTNTAYHCVGQVIVNDDDLSFDCGLVIGSNNNYPHSTTIYLTQGNNAENTIILRIRYQNNKFWIRRLGTFNGNISAIRMWITELYRR